MKELQAQGSAKRSNAAPNALAGQRSGEATSRNGLTRPDVVLFSLAALACLALVVLTWANTLSNGFHFDDSHVVVNNLFIRDLKHTPRYFVDARTFSSLPANAAYRPVATLSLALDYALAGGMSSRFFHGSQIFLLTLLWMALWLFYRRVLEYCNPGRQNIYLALVAATIFAVHTVNSETMNLISARSEILSALGLVGAFLAYFSLRGRKKTVVSLLAMTAGALAKVPAVLFGPLLFSWTFLTDTRDGEQAPVREPAAGRFRRALAVAWPAIVAGALVFAFVTKMDAPAANYVGSSPIAYARTQTWVWLHYLRLFALPSGLTADTDLELISKWYDTRVIAGILAIGSLAFIGIKCSFRRETWPITFGLAWFAIGLLPTSSVIALAEPVNEHRVFLPYIGLTLAVVWAAWRLVQKWTNGRSPSFALRLTCAGAILAMGALALGAHVRNEAWASDESLWRDVTLKSPGNGRGWMNYGLALMERGDLTGAKSAFDHAQSLLANYWALEVNLGVVNGALGNQSAAESHFRRAFQLAPQLPETSFFYARWLVERGRSPEGLGYLDKAIGASPAYEPALKMKMDLLAARGDSAAARLAATAYLSLDPSSARARAYVDGLSPIPVDSPSYQAFVQKGLALGQEKNFIESALAYRAALALDPRSADALNNLGWTLGQLGFLQEGISTLEAALRVNPTYALARNNLAWVQGQALVASRTSPK